jgi:Nucleotidyl transferase AbiEii toxin, Type IV TA system
MVSLGIGDSRMKDFYDLWFLARSFDFRGRDLRRAIQTTFKRRKTPLPAEPPLALTAEFGTDAVKVKQWQAFLRKNKLNVADMLLEQVCQYLAEFLMPPVKAIVADEAFEKSWPSGGPWADELSV